MNTIRQQVRLLQNHVDQHHHLPSQQEISELCHAGKSKVKPILRRYMIYQYINKYTQTNGYPPSRREISDALHIPLSVTQYHFEKLVQADLLDWVPNQSRSIRITTLEI